MMQLLKNYIRSKRHTKILKSIKIEDGNFVLDMSCSDGKFLDKLYSLNKSLKLYGIDISEVDIKKAKEDLPYADFRIENVNNVSFTDSSFDIIFSIMSLHHYANPDLFFKEVYRILKPEGVFYLVDFYPRNKLFQNYHNYKGCNEPYHFEKFYLEKDLEVILRKYNFKIVNSELVTYVPQIRILKILKI